MDTQGLHWELLVIDNGSTDETPALLEEYSVRLPLRSLFQPLPGKNRSLNSALDLLSGELTVLTDDDVLVPADWLQAWKAASARWPQEAVFGGRIVPHFPPGTPSWIAAPGFPARAQCFAAFDPPWKEGPCRGTVFGPNFAVRTRLFREHRFADRLGPAGGVYAMGGETEFLWRLRDAGHRIIYVPSASVQHCIEQERLSVAALYARGRNAGRGDELRRSVDRRLGPVRLWLRLWLLIEPRIAWYRLLYRGLFFLSEPVRFRRGYKLHRTYGRRQQLQELLGVQPAAQQQTGSGA